MNSSRLVLLSAAICVLFGTAAFSMCSATCILLSVDMEAAVAPQQNCVGFETKSSKMRV